MSFDIYILDLDPVKAVRALDDRRLRDAPTHAVAALHAATEMRLAVAAARPVKRGTPHPRHQLTRRAASSSAFASWVHAYGDAAAHEYEYRFSATCDDAEVSSIHARLSELTPVDVVRRVAGDRSMGVTDDEVLARRVAFVTSKIPGAPEAWAGADIGWTRREPPAWLVGAGARRGREHVVVSSVPWCGLGAEPTHTVWTARYEVDHAAETD